MADSIAQPEYKAYARLPRDHARDAARAAAALDSLLETARRVESPLLRDVKPVIAIALKWKFDYLAKTLDSPFEIERDVTYWTDLLRVLRTLGEQRWFELAAAGAPAMDVWERTAHGFDVGWTTTTQGERFQASREIARERLTQILAMLGGEGWVRGKEILDSGCGPGRYVDLLRHLGPRRIIGLDQGPALVDTLRERFRGVAAVEIVQGTCEKLEFADASFDFVISNGVLHHTRSDLRTMLTDHCRVLRPGGVMFVMLIGKGGLELKLWEFLRAFLYDVPIESMLQRFGKAVSPLRLQGIVDHMYGEYQETERVEFEAWCRALFTRIERVAGIEGLDVTPEIYRDDLYFAARFGCGHLRYLCHK
jgi:ubiquinone/menaquinone biosynthesis C-methylase UbiE